MTFGAGRERHEMAERVLLTSGRVVAGGALLDGACVLLEGTRVADVLTSAPPAALLESARVLDVGGRIVAPGLIDLHIHGAAGRSFEEAALAQDGPADDAVPAILRHLASVGVTATQASLASDRVDVMAGKVRALHAWRDRGVPDGADLLGVHLEGPFLAEAQAGAHEPSKLRAPSAADVAALASLAPAMVTLAPELPGAVDAIRAFAAVGTVVAAGHSEATVPALAAAVEAGLRHVTHLWSGQSSTIRSGPWRVPGLLEASLSSDSLTAEVIADGKHLPPALLEIARRCLGERLVVVSDATQGAGMPEGYRYGLADVRCEVRDGVGMVIGADAFGGSTTTLAAMLAHLYLGLGWPLLEVIAMGSSRPARVAGVADRKGALTPGHDADVVVFSDDLVPWRTFVRGHEVPAGV
ncbi:N-acetylglucosamine-6-phosphate deacetylase [Occultella gossypii]|uniref:Amidohydrolase family protein n=1 Tax=Occultella gossypii TaxID=2800820 RepID=A0ABS7S971_9MICO|nr:amidohydrolase family protein [Occultella gossypii]MBZ2196837.1 amidohydrolase family protein [Occultella gossypii]